MSNHPIIILLNKSGLLFEKIEQLDGTIIPRDMLLNPENYNQVKKIIPQMKSYFSSTYMNSLQSTAEKKQKWPLINLLRQMLKASQYKMVPLRKAEGYTKDKKKIFRRYFRIVKIEKNTKGNAISTNPPQISNLKEPNNNTQQIDYDKLTTKLIQFTS